MIGPITANEDPNKGFGNNTNESNNTSMVDPTIVKVDNSQWADLFEQYNNSDLYMNGAAVGPTDEQWRFLDIGDSGKPMNVSPIKPLSLGLSHYSRFGIVR